MKVKLTVLVVTLLAAGVGGGSYLYWRSSHSSESSSREQPAAPKTVAYRPWEALDSSGFRFAFASIKSFRDPTSLDEIREASAGLGYRNIDVIDRDLARPLGGDEEIKLLLSKAALLLYEGDAKEAYQVLQKARDRVETSDALRQRWLYTIIYYQGVAGLRRGETENCLECRGEGACIFPLRPSALHTNPAGSRLAIRHFTEYVEQFPDDLGARWLLNLASMTLGEHPDQVPQRHRLAFDNFGAEFDIGKFRDIGHLVCVNRLNRGGGAIMDDFDNDGLLDVVVSSWDPAQPVAFFRNKGDGTFEDRTLAAGLGGQGAGSNLVQGDYNNDGFLDIFVVRGAWLPYPMRPSLLRNNGDGTFTDVTREAGLIEPGNSIAAAWADFDNDGFLDLFVCNERGPNRLYRNRGDGTFEEVAARAGVLGKDAVCKGVTWIDYDNDGYPDLFVTYLRSTPQLFHNNRDGTFTDVTIPMGITGPRMGFSCWAFDYDNDGWLDIFATSYNYTLSDLVRGMLGQPPSKNVDVTRLYHNQQGKKFVDVSKETGVDKVFATMGSNFGDFDNDGYLDFYLGTGGIELDLLVPNRMFKNVDGKRFAEITTPSGTGHLQKGHGVACGDWDRDGNVDLFIELGGATPGDRYHNALFQNPGHGNNWLTVKLVGKKTNRAAIGARIKVVTAGGDSPLTVHRHVSSGSSFGGNPLQQTIGLGKGRSIATLEIQWPTSQTTQVFHDVPANQAIEVTEFATDYRPLNWTRVPVPAAEK